MKESGRKASLCSANQEEALKLIIEATTID